MISYKTFHALSNAFGKAANHQIQSMRANQQVFVSMGGGSGGRLTNDHLVVAELNNQFRDSTNEDVFVRIRQLTMDDVTGFVGWLRDNMKHPYRDVFSVSDSGNGQDCWIICQNKDDAMMLKLVWG